MKKTFFKAFSVMALAVAFMGCDKTENDEKSEPSVIAELEGSTITSLSYKITPVNSVKCAWVVLDADAELPSVESVLKDGVPAHANEPSVVTKDGLEPNTDYQIVVAVEDADKLTAFNCVSGQTEDVPAVAFDSNRASGKKYGKGNIGVTLRTEVDGVDYEADLDIYGDFSVGYLTEGTYTVSASDEGNVICTAYSGTYVQIGNDQKVPESGNLVVSIDKDKKTYALELRLKMKDGSFFHGTFNGVIDNVGIK